MRLKKEKRPKLKKVGNRTAVGNGELSFNNIDNHSSNAFGGYAHDIKLMTTDELWARLEAEIDKIYAAQNARKISDSLNHVSTYQGSLAALSKAAFDNTPTPIPIYDTFPPNSLGSIFKAAFDQAQNIKFPSGYVRSLELLEEARTMLFQVPESLKKIQNEQEEDFRRAASWRSNKPTNDPEWDALQASLKPSLVDEDPLGDFAQWLENFPKDHQYLMIGDTNHSNRGILNWLREGSYLSALKEHGFTDIVVEAGAKLNTDIALFYDTGKASENLKKDRMFKLIACAKKMGIRAHALDAQIGNGKKMKDILPTRHQNDRVLADDILAATGDRKTAIVYGCAHFSYMNSLPDLLGREKCRVINVHEDLTDYHSPAVKFNATYPAPYVYVVAEDQVIASNGRYQRIVSPSRDRYLQKIVLPNEQDRHIEEFLQRYADRKEKDPVRYSQINPEAVIQTIKDEEDEKRIRDARRRDSLELARSDLFAKLFSHHTPK